MLHANSPQRSAIRDRPRADRPPSVAFRSVPAQKVPLTPRFASRADRGTRNPRAMQVLLGHESISTTERYTAVDDSEIRAAMIAAVGD